MEGRGEGKGRGWERREWVGSRAGVTDGQQPPTQARQTTRSSEKKKKKFNSVYIKLC